MALKEGILAGGNLNRIPKCMWENDEKKRLDVEVWSWGKSQSQRYKFVNTGVWMTFTDMELEWPKLSREEDWALSPGELNYLRTKTRNGEAAEKQTSETEREKVMSWEQSKEKHFGKQKVFKWIKCGHKVGRENFPFDLERWMFLVTLRQGK